MLHSANPTYSRVLMVNFFHAARTAAGVGLACVIPLEWFSRCLIMIRLGQTLLPAPEKVKPGGADSPTIGWTRSSAESRPVSHSLWIALAVNTLLALAIRNRPRGCVTG